MNPVYSRTMIDHIKAEIEAIHIDQNEMKEQIKSLSETVSSLEQALKELTIAIAAGLPIK